MSVEKERGGYQKGSPATKVELRKITNEYLKKRGLDMVGIGDLGSSDESSDCEGFFDCRMGAMSIAPLQSKWRQRIAIYEKIKAKSDLYKQKML